MAAVPKGFLRYQVLEALSEKPMSGSEIMNEIERRTDGRWKPSPGSIYPLLAWLQDNDYIKELPSDESGLKRYEVTTNGKKLLEEQRKMKTKFKNEGGFFPPPFIGALWFRIPPEKSAEFRSSLRRLAMAIFELGAVLEESFSEEAVEEARKIINETIQKLEDVKKKLEEK